MKNFAAKENIETTKLAKLNKKRSFLKAKCILLWL